MSDITDYLAEIGRKGGSVKGKNKGNQHALKYTTDTERLEARKAQQKAYRERKKKEKK
jgi:hypothetical protein